MDVALLSAMISELITGHDQVGLPGLGTFVAEVVPATFSDKGYTINPPYRRLSFHPSNSEDRLLIDLYAASNGISKEAAGVYVRQFLSEMKSALKERKVIALPGLGRLRATVENNFFFVADPDLDIYPDGFALKPLSLKAMADSEPAAILSPITSAAEQRETPQPEAEAEVEAEPQAEVASAPELEPEQVVELESEPELVIEPAAFVEPKPDSEIELESASRPEPEPEREPVAEPAPEPESEFEVKPEPEQAIKPEPVIEPKPKPEPASQPEPIPETAPAVGESRPRSRFRWWVPLLILLAVVAVALLAFLTVAQVAPDLIDSILYTPEELRIINY